MADKHLYDHNHLAQELFDFLLLRSGKAFDGKTPAPPSDGWSQTVWDLIDVGLKKAFNRKNSGRTRSPRTGGGPIYLADGACFAATTTRAATSTVSGILGHSAATMFFEPQSEGPPQDGPPMDDNLVPDAGVSIILIETNEAEREM